MKDLAATLWHSVELPHGRISTHNNPDDPSPELYQDYFPGQVLLALAVACEQNVSTIDEERLRRSFQYYRHRFRYKRHFGQVTWLLQAFSKWWQVTADRDFADLVFEIADWLLGYQQDKTGAFINDHQSDTPGYTTAVYLEGIAAALKIADSLADQHPLSTLISTRLRAASAFSINSSSRSEIAQYFPISTGLWVACGRDFITAKFGPTSYSTRFQPSLNLLHPRDLRGKTLASV